MDLRIDRCPLSRPIRPYRLMANQSRPFDSVRPVHVFAHERQNSFGVPPIECFIRLADALAFRHCPLADGSSLAFVYQASRRASRAIYKWLSLQARVPDPASSSSEKRLPLPTPPVYEARDL